MNKHIAIVLAGGRGSRMNSDIPKQYMVVKGYPVLYYALKTFEDSFMDEIILVTGKEEVEYCRKEIVDRYGIHKVHAIVPGGKERYDSVFAGLQQIAEMNKGQFQDIYVYIHDGARACINAEILNSCRSDVEMYQACVAAVPVKDTIKIVDQNGFAVSTPSRDTLWQVQTPQSFRFDIVYEAYRKMMQANEQLSITDDAMVVEHYANIPVKMTKSAYTNIKITTQDDIMLVEQIIKTQ